jgi:hypothetical protein
MLSCEDGVCGWEAPSSLPREPAVCGCSELLDTKRLSRESLTAIAEEHTSELAALGDRWAVESACRSSGTRPEIDTLSSAASMPSMLEASLFGSDMPVGS